MFIIFKILSRLSDRSSYIRLENRERKKKKKKKQVTERHKNKTPKHKLNTAKCGNNITYSISAAEKSGLLKVTPALYFVNEAEVVLNPISAPRQRSLLPIAAESSNRGDGFKPILESMAA